MPRFLNLDGSGPSAGRRLGRAYEPFHRRRLRVEPARPGLQQAPDPAVGVTHDRASAALAGTASTGHALPPPNHEGGFPSHLILEPGGTDQERLISGLERGLLVTRFHYTNLAHAMTSTITGMTRDGTFLVEDGRVVASVRNLRFTQSILDALSHVEAVGSSLEVSSDPFEGSAAAPAMRISRFHFTSTSGH